MDKNMNEKHPDEYPPLEPGEEIYSPYLVIRYASSDPGLRPVPFGTPFWKSPDIWVKSPDPSGNPVAGGGNWVYANITNMGTMDALGVRVEFWWANPSLAINKTTANLIGTIYVSVPGLSTVPVKCPTLWIPVQVNKGHECLIVQCSLPIFDPIVSPFDPVSDRHVGQRNVHVISAAAGEKVEFTLNISNPSPITQEAEIFLTPLSHEEITTIVGNVENRTIVGNVENCSRTAAGLLPSVQVKVSEEQRFSLARPLSFAQRLLTDSGFAQDPKSRSYRQHGVELQTLPVKGWEERELSLSIQVPWQAKTGETYAFEVSQWLTGIIMGGYTLVIEVRETETVTKEIILELQKKLTELGYNLGPIDGIWGNKTIAAVEKFQRDNGLPVTGKIDEETKKKLDL